VAGRGEAKGEAPGAGAKASLKRASKSRLADPKPGELPLARLKRGGDLRGGPNRCPWQRARRSWG